MELHEVSPDEKLTEASAHYDTERYFIFTFETLPILWDQKHKLYSSKYKRLEALKQLQSIYNRIKPGATIDDVRKKINALRSNYRRELRKIEASKKLGGNVYKPRLWSYQYLDFLKNAEHPDALLRKAKIKVKTESLLQSEQGENSSSSEKEIEPMEFNDQYTLSDKTISSRTPKALTSTDVKTLNNPSNVFEHSNSNLLLPQTSFPPTQPMYIHSSTLATLWIEKLERLHPVQKLFAEKAINDILFEAELGNLRKNSVKINEPLITEAGPYAVIPSTSPHLVFNSNNTDIKKADT